MNLASIPKSFPIPKRPCEDDYLTYKEIVRSGLFLKHSAEDEEVIENEVICFSQGEWMHITREIRSLAVEFALNDEQVRLIMQLVTERHKKAWGPYGDMRCGDEKDFP